MSTFVSFSRTGLRSLAIAALAVSGGILPAAPTSAQTAARFVDSIGVNVHAHTHYLKDPEGVTRKLGELGVMHIRDGIHPKACEAAMRYYEAYGIRTLWITGRRKGGEEEYLSPLNPEAIAGELKEVRESALPATEAIEGPNEYDIHSDSRDPDWPATLRDYQKKVHEQVRNDPSLRGLTVVGPSMTSPQAYQKVGDLDPWINAACIHHYQSFRNPGTPGWGADGYGSIDWTKRAIVSLQSPTGKPLWSTECGYRLTGNESVSEEVEAKYLPRMFAEFFRKGYFRSYKYELMGEEYGLMGTDLKERPAYRSLANLIAILKDRPAASGAALDYSLTGAPADLRQVLLSRATGDFDLMVWRELPGWDGVARQVIEVKPAPVTLRLDGRPSGITIYVPRLSKNPQDSRETAPVHALAIGDDLTIIRITKAH